MGLTFIDIETYGNDIIPETFEESFENWDELSQNQRFIHIDIKKTN
jgi:hypothetical protein